MRYIKHARLICEFLHKLLPEKKKKANLKLDFSTMCI